MAYAAAITYSDSIIAGRRHLLVTVSETEAAAASEYSLSLGAYMPTGKWKVKRGVSLLTAGTGYPGTTIANVFGTATNPTSGTVAYIGTLGGAATSQDSTNSGNGWVGQGTTMYARSVVSADADNSVTTYWYIVEGWDG